MKSSSTNTFNEGLNYDLNPNVTPNSVLTDCINGTFITFNKDELSLQNDAGNTKIGVIGTEVPNTNPVQYTEYVQLEDGFLPLGVKEYGGVLYIVSAKLPVDNSIVWTPNSKYTEGQIVCNIAENIDLEKLYYISKVNDNNELLPYESNKYWEIIGSKKDFNNKYGQVQFGSYPSPEASGMLTFDGIPITYVEPINIKNKLYKKNVINLQDFKTTRYITFNNSLTPNTNNISRYQATSGILGTYEPIFYKLKLYHQLSNGYLDLTNDIWGRFAMDKLTLNDNFWFDDETFKYYCPSRYKGKLSIALEIEELEKFKLKTVPTFSYTDPNFNLNFIVETKGIGHIEVQNVLVKVWINNNLLEETIVPVTDTLAYFYSGDILEDQKGQLATYEVIPILTVDGTTYSSSDFPEEYINKYIIKGSLIVDWGYENIKFIFNTDNTTCQTTPVGYKIYNEIIVTDILGNYVDKNLDFSLLPHVFILDAPGVTATTPNAVELGKFVVYGDEIRIIEFSQPDINHILLNLVEKVNVSFYSPEDCGEITSDPNFVGVNQFGKVTLITDLLNYKVLTTNDTVLSNTLYAPYTCVDYVREDKLLFIGEKEGMLTIIDLNDANNPIVKRISISNLFDNRDVTSVNFINSGINKRIYIGHPDRDSSSGDAKPILFYIPYSNDISSYPLSDAATKVIIDSTSIEGSIRDIIYYGGYNYGITNLGEIIKWNDSFSFSQIADVSTNNFIELGVTQNKLMLIDTSNRNFYANKSNTNLFTEWHLPGSRTPRQFIPITADTFIITGENADYSIWKIVMHNDTINTINITSNSNAIYARGGFYDSETNSVYLSTSTIAYNYITTYNVANETWGNMEVPDFYNKLYKY